MSAERERTEARGWPPMTEYCQFGQGEGACRKPALYQDDTPNGTGAWYCEEHSEPTDSKRGEVE